MYGVFSGGVACNYHSICLYIYTYILYMYYRLQRIATILRTPADFPCGRLAGSKPDRVKPMSTRCYLACCSALLQEGKDWFAYHQDDMTEWDIRSWW